MDLLTPLCSGLYIVEPVDLVSNETELTIVNMPPCVGLVCNLCIIRDKIFILGLIPVAQVGLIFRVSTIKRDEGHLVLAIFHILEYTTILGN